MFKTLSVANQTQKCFVDAGTEAGLQEDKFVNTANASVPNNYVYTGYVENVGGMGVAFYPVPDKVYNLKFNVVDRSEEMTDADDLIVVPYLPVIQFATAMAAEERGETGGASAQSLYALAKSSLADAISMDAARFPTETIWYDV
jgi:predicted urease superfamily metal-dependent hydrolase